MECLLSTYVDAAGDEQEAGLNPYSNGMLTQFMKKFIDVKVGS